MVQIIEVDHLNIQSTANTWERKIIEVAGDTSGTYLTDAGRGIILRWCMGIGADRQAALGSYSAQEVHGTSNQTNLFATNSATFQITGLQFEEGSAATDFEHLSYAEELTLCQRYYYQMVHDSARRFGVDGLYSPSTGAGLNIMFTHPVPMRAGPTVTPGSSMTGNTVSFSNDETHIYMYTTGHSSGRVGVETSSGTTTVSAEI